MLEQLLKILSAYYIQAIFLINIFQQFQEILPYMSDTTQHTTV